MEDSLLNMEDYLKKIEVNMETKMGKKDDDPN